MNIKEIHNVYFLGIGGIGMSALARYFLFVGKNVAGYDRVSTPLTIELEAQGAEIHYEDDLTLISKVYFEKDTLIVYTPALPDTHKELSFFKENNFNLQKRSAVLGAISNAAYCMAVAGTHGKTTTSCILAHILNEANAPLMSFLGGVSENFNSNFILKGTDYAVAEADEFDRSFLSLTPDIACITTMDPDHLDIYGTPESLVVSFNEFVGNIKEGGKLIVRNGLPLQGITYGEEEGSDYKICDVSIQNGAYNFTLSGPDFMLENLRFLKPGKHNLLNAVAAFAMAVESGFNPEVIGSALGSFLGVKRRFSYQIKNENFVFIDDYAHHPTEINAVYQAVTEMYPEKRSLAVFQPHLFTRTRDFAKEFAVSLSQFNTVLLLDVYPAREKPISGINSHWLLDQLSVKDKRVVTKNNLYKHIKEYKPEVLVTMGAGDIGVEVPKLKKLLLNE